MNRNRGVDCGEKGRRRERGNCSGGCKIKKKKLMGIPGHIKPDLPQIKTQKNTKGAGERRWGRRRKEMEDNEENG